MSNNNAHFFNKQFWKQQELDHVLIYTSINRRWFNNFISSYGFYIISKAENKQYCFFDERYLHEAKKTIKKGKIYPLQRFLTFWKKLTGKCGFEKRLSYDVFATLKKLNPQLTLIPLDFDHFRMIKSEQEIQNLRQICQITKTIWNQVLQFIQIERTEKAVEKFIMQKFLDQNITELSFHPIVSSGANSALIHTQAKAQIIKGNLLCDFGGKINGYCSDFTRSIILEPNHKLQSYLQIVEKIQRKVIEQIKPGKTIGEIVQIAKNIYQKNQLHCAHALGHGVGLKVHEKPDFIDNSKIVMVPGMVFTIEPGIYVPELGGVRMEDVVLVTKKGCEILTR